MWWRTQLWVTGAPRWWRTQVQNSNGVGWGKARNGSVELRGCGGHKPGHRSYKVVEDASSISGAPTQWRLQVQVTGALRQWRMQTWVTRTPTTGHKPDHWGSDMVEAASVGHWDSEVVEDANVDHRIPTTGHRLDHWGFDLVEDISFGHWSSNLVEDASQLALAVAATSSRRGERGGKGTLGHGGLARLWLRWRQEEGSKVDSPRASSCSNVVEDAIVGHRSPKVVEDSSAEL
ncbi:hypothetical protein TREES_T100004956 [Tupaia chinensis]|uniref:Uncharacterized protein n=1 Tax=Tupaia chinensis TaxID=246437 RepID=L9LDQ1_TUPCH|nr:hypothetical protein TREES_T100004956 [Tupaia chinensis]